MIAHADMWVKSGRDFYKGPKVCARCGRSGTQRFETFNYGGPWRVDFWRCTNKDACQRRYMKDFFDFALGLIPT